ncbi:unnamed protein product [Lactuca virosa]|uniref:Hexosyltransferase n=1 Tax=Lactuca virosa TaxID=75947 RepID=A0AAU9LC95_9ASTR|nr:unnamed protein product [Lactuca virosa]
MVTMWDAEFYIKVDNDVHVNIGHTLVRHRKKKRVYIGCMKSGPAVVSIGKQEGLKGYWKGNLAQVQFNYLLMGLTRNFIGGKMVSFLLLGD